MAPLQKEDNLMKTLNFVINSLVKFVMGASSLILSVVTMLAVITRFIFQNPIPWSQDIIRICFVYLVFWGGAYCIKEKEHLNIDILLTSVNEKARIIIELIINIILLLFFVFLVYFGFIFVQSGVSQKAPYLPIPMSVYYLSLPTSAILMIYYQLQIIFGQLKNFKENNNPGGERA